MPRLTRNEQVDVIVDILKRAGEPISGRQFKLEAKRIFGDEWTDSLRIDLECMRTALRSVRIVSHDRDKKLWGLTSYADQRLAELEGVDIWLEHKRIRDKKHKADT